MSSFHDTSNCLGSLRVFQQFFGLEIGSVKVALSPPTRQRVPHTVGRPVLIHSEAFLSLSNRIILVPINNRSDMHWAPRVSLSKIRQLYLRESQGICEDELVDEVGWSLYLRCESILEFTEAVQTGRVTCQRCAVDGSITSSTIS